MMVCVCVGSVAEGERVLRQNKRWGRWLQYPISRLVLSFFSSEGECVSAVSRFAYYRYRNNKTTTLQLIYFVFYFGGSE